MAERKINVEFNSTTRLFPTVPAPTTTVPLSVVDSATLHYGPSAAVWFFNPPVDRSDTSLQASQLKESLQQTLSTFTHLAGHLEVTKYDPNGDHTTRFGRLQIRYGTDNDPGVEFNTANCESSLDDFIPNDQRRKTSELQSWDISGASATTFLPEMAKLPFRAQNPTLPPSAVLIQATQFACGGIGIGAMIAHPLADARTLALFMHHWSYTHSTLFSNAPKTTPPAPLFNPQLLDTSAAGDINASSPDESILQKARSLPSLRHDTFLPAADGDPDRFLPPGLTRDMIKSPGIPMPLADWYGAAPVSHVKLHFSGSQIKRICDSTGGKVSRHDAILAHVWRAVNRARGWGDDDENVSLHVIFGMRKRLGLPDSFLGSPILSTTITATGKEASSELAIGDVAGRINNTLALYDEDALKARIHDMCFECAPQRFWEGFLGARHMIFTSWAHLNIYAIDFGGERGAARYVDVKMPDLDGMIWLTESRPSDGLNLVEGRHWCDDGVDISLNIGSEAATKLREDTSLWM